MRLPYFKPLILMAFLTLPVMSYALSTKEELQKFNTECAAEWMKGTENVSDKVAYKDFGEKYCSCMSTNPLDSETDMKNSARTCMSETLLKITMENLGEDLPSLTEAKIVDECLREWDFVGTILVGSQKGQIAGFCKCAAPKLNEMNANRDNMTDEDWDNKIDSIAKMCS